MAATRPSIGTVALPGLLLLLTALPAAARDSFDAQYWKPALDPFAYITVEGGRVLAPGHFHASLYASYASNPAELTVGRPNSTDPTDTDLVTDIGMLDIVGSVGVLRLFDHGGIEVGADMPIAPYVRGEKISIDATTGLPDELRNAAQGDLRTEVKAIFLDRESDDIGLGVKAEVLWPTGSGSNFLSNDGRFGFAGSLIADKRLRLFRAAIELGYQFLPVESVVGGVLFDDRIKLGAALGCEPWREAPSDDWKKPISFVVEVFGSSLARHPWEREVESPLEVGGAVRYNGTIQVLLGAGGGIGDGVGAPSLRVFLGLGVTF